MEVLSTIYEFWLKLWSCWYEKWERPGLLQIVNPSFSHKVCHVLQYNDHGESLILMPLFWTGSQENRFSPIMPGEGNKIFGNFLDRSKRLKLLLKKKSWRNKKHRQNSEEGINNFLREKPNIMAGPRVGQRKLASRAENLSLKRSHETVGKNPHQLMSSDSCPRNSPKCWGTREKEINISIGFFVCVSFDFMISDRDILYLDTHEDV